jgi:hypothetical protein
MVHQGQAAVPVEETLPQAARRIPGGTDRAPNAVVRVQPAILAAQRLPEECVGKHIWREVYGSKYSDQFAFEKKFIAFLTKEKE